MQIQITSRMCGVALNLMVALTYSVFLAANVEMDTWFNIRTTEGEIIQEKITVTGTEEVITLGDGGRRIVYDYEKGFKTVRLNDDGVLRCLVASFDRRGLESPANEQVKDEMTSGDVAELSETDYYVDASSEVDPAILSESSRAMCEHLPIQWMSEKPEMSAVSAGGRKKRACRRVCSASCSCCPRDCRLECHIECSF